MILLIISIIILIIGLIMLSIDEFDYVGFLCRVIGVIMVVLIIMFLSIEYYSTLAEIERFYAIKLTFEKSRVSVNQIENAAIQIKIAGANEWLAEKQFWNNTLLFDGFIPDIIDSLKPIE